MNMKKPSFDPGLTQQYIKPLSRVINKDGEFNVRRIGGAWRDFHPYMILINMSWPVFLGTIVLGYTLINLVFACTYYAVGVEQLEGANAPTALGRFLNMFFFSSHTLSTVGYGNIAPRGIGANTVAAFEALTGILVWRWPRDCFSGAYRSRPPGSASAPIYWWRRIRMEPPLSFASPIAVPTRW